MFSFSDVLLNEKRPARMNLKNTIDVKSVPYKSPDKEARQILNIAGRFVCLETQFSL